MMADPGECKEGLTCKKYIVALAVIWTVVALILELWEVHKTKNRILQMAAIEAEMAYEKDLSYRRWNTMHGGVYVPITEKTPPNPYIKLPERDITTPSGKRLTLMNPAYMTRQVYETSREEFNVLGHITSLKPIRPENAPDAWEAEALKSFEKGQKASFKVDMINDVEFMRLMRPLVTEKGCLLCHADQGYKEGEIRGGISVAVPMDSAREFQRGETLISRITHITLWLVGLGILGLIYRRVRKMEGEPPPEEK